MGDKIWMPSLTEIGLRGEREIDVPDRAFYNSLMNLMSKYIGQPLTQENAERFRQELDSLRPGDSFAERAVPEPELPDYAIDPSEFLDGEGPAEGDCSWWWKRSPEYRFSDWSDLRLDYSSFGPSYPRYVGEGKTWGMLTPYPYLDPYSTAGLYWDTSDVKKEDDDEP